MAIVAMLTDKSPRDVSAVFSGDGADHYIQVLGASGATTEVDLQVAVSADAAPVESLWSHYASVSPGRPALFKALAGTKWRVVARSGPTDGINVKLSG